MENNISNYDLAWRKEARKAMIDKGFIRCNDVAKATKMSPTIASQILNGRLICPPKHRLISEYLGIPDEV